MTTVWLVLSDDVLSEVVNAKEWDHLELSPEVFELHVAEEPPYSDDAGLFQIPVRELILTAYNISPVTERK